MSAKEQPPKNSYDEAHGTQNATSRWLSLRFKEREGGANLHGCKSRPSLQTRRSFVSSEKEQSASPSEDKTVQEIVTGKVIRTPRVKPHSIKFPRPSLLSEIQPRGNKTPVPRPIRQTISQEKLQMNSFVSGEKEQSAILSGDKIVHEVVKGKVRRGKGASPSNKFSRPLLLTEIQPGENVMPVQTPVPHPIQRTLSQEKSPMCSRFSASWPQPITGWPFSQPKYSKKPLTSGLKTTNINIQNAKRFEDLSPLSVGNKKTNALPSLGMKTVKKPTQNKVYMFPKKKSITSNKKTDATGNQNVNSETLKQEQKQSCNNENNKLLNNSQVNSASSSVSRKPFDFGNKIKSQKTTFNQKMLVNKNYKAQEKVNLQETNSNCPSKNKNIKKPPNKISNAENDKEASKVSNKNTAKTPKRNKRSDSFTARLLLSQLLSVPEKEEINLKEIKLTVNNLESNDRDNSCLVEVVDVLNQLSSDEISFKKDILKIFSHYKFLKVIQSFVLQKVKDCIKTEEGKEKWEMFFKQFVQLTKLSIDNLPARELSSLSHTLVLIRSIMGRLYRRIDVQEHNLNISSMLNLMESKIKREDLEREKVSVDEKNEIKTISILPTKKDLFSTTSGLKKNVIEGAYEDVEHYLTVQFKLLREDFIAPLREGAAEYLASLRTGSTVRKSGLIVYYNVQVLHASIDSGKFGYIVKLGGKVNLEMIKHFFIFGSLLFFTKDDFDNFFLGTVIDVNYKSLTVTVKLNENYFRVCEDIYAEKFVMAVSKVFFEPYFHVLTALQEMEADKFPMEKYIVKVNPDPKPPAYIQELGLTKYNIQEKRVNILDPTWDEFGLVKFNPSQHKAFQAALTNEFVAIQGPPGTGKTFLGHQIVSTLLDNVHTNTPILVVCYKNHALDQFLECILKKTSRIVRIGGRSQNKSLERFNIKKLRGRYDYAYFADNLKTLSKEYFRKKYCLDGLKKHGIVSLKDLLPYIQSPEFQKQITQNYYEDWLMEGMHLGDDDESLFIDVDECSDFRRVTESMDHGNKFWETEMSQNTSIGSADCLEANFGILKNQNHLKFENNDVLYGSFVQSGESPTEIGEYQLVAEDDIEDDSNSDGDSGTLVDDDESNIDEDWKAVKEHLPKQSSTAEKNAHLIQQSEKSVMFNNSGAFKNLEENQKRLDQMYMDDYSEVYKQVSKEIKAEISQNIPGNQSHNSDLPAFHLTIHSLKILGKKYQEEINKLQKEIENISTDKSQDPNNENQLTEEEKEILTHKKERMILAHQKSIEDLKARISYLHKMIHEDELKLNDDQVEKLYQFGSQTSIWALNTRHRWALYHNWVAGLARDIRKQMIQVENTIRVEEQEVDKARNEADLKILEEAEVVGMTTTGAAKLRPMLNKLGAKIVLIEEAAEVLESHIVAALSDKCQHVILIGDHKQLRPNPAVYKLCTKYNFDVSLFERMIKNGLCCYQLSVQHRMRPEFASLIVPTIYDNLTSHPSTVNRPDILGVKSNLFFVNHNHLEEHMPDSVSHVNHYEAAFVVEFARYLLLQGYKCDEITILATYSRQVRQIQKLQEGTTPVTSNIRVSSVDDFQGEENKIILLSLVRSNENKSVGFLKTENRVCVALSRARDGLYIIGNMDLLVENSEIWPKVKESLLKHNAYGESLSVYCQNHPGTILSVNNGDIIQGLPEGGCHLKCDTKLICGHDCQFFCHPRDQAHEESYACSSPCERKICARNHPCPRICSKKCKPCMVGVEYKLLCGHNMTAACSADENQLECKTMVISVLSSCGHEVLRYCHETEEDREKRECTSICGKEMECGHNCADKCHVNLWACLFMNCSEVVETVLQCGHTKRTECCAIYPEHKITLVECDERADKSFSCGHVVSGPCTFLQELKMCPVIVEKILPCEHKIQIECSKSIENVVCTGRSVRTLPCGHQVEAECTAALADIQCQVLCAKMAPCGHPCEQVCSLPCSCKVHVEKILLCGHVCIAYCNQNADLIKCQVRVKSSLLPFCGHGPVDIPCHFNKMDSQTLVKQLAALCQAACQQTLRCGHPCPGICSGCTLKHADCDKQCGRILMCGHLCPLKCEEPCAPCYQNCLNRCEHKMCGGVCGGYCLPCKEPCTLGCIHRRCSRYCSFFCNRRPCDFPCPLYLPCGHPCMGLCGELCPFLCPMCNPMVFGGRDVSKTRFIMLEDCGHIMEVNWIDQLITRQSQKLAKCPVCQQPIVTTKRYRDANRQIFRNMMHHKKRIQAQSVTQAEKNYANSYRSGRGRYQHNQRRYNCPRRYPSSSMRRNLADNPWE